MSEIKKYQKAMNFKANPRYLTRDFIVPLYTGTEPDIVPETSVEQQGAGSYTPFPNDMPIVSPKEIQNQPYEQLNLADGGSVERQGFAKGSVPPGYITGKELEELTGIPNLSVKAKELMYAPKAYKRQKNLFGDFYKKQLKAKYFDIGQGGKYGTLHYKKPTAEQIQTMKEYHLRRGAKYGVSKATADRMKLFHNDPKLRNYVRNGKLIPDELLKEYGVTRNEAAQSTFRLAQAYNGKKFANVDVGIPKNRSAGKKLFEEIDKAPFGNPYKMAQYKEALNVITEGIGDKYFETTTFEDMKREARRILQKEKIPVFDPTIKGSKGINVNELTGVTASSRNKSFPYSQFINLMEGNLNTKAYAGFNKQFEKYEKNLQNEIAKGNKGNPNKIIKEYKNYTKDFLGGLEDVDKAQIEKLGLPELSLKEPTELYGKKRTAQLLGQGLDLPGSYKELGYSIKVPKGTATLKEFINNPDVRNKAIQMIGDLACGVRAKAMNGGRINFSEGSDCFNKGLKILEEGNLNKQQLTLAEKAIASADEAAPVLKNILNKAGSGIKFTGLGVKELISVGAGPIGLGVGALLESGQAIPELAKGDWREAIRSTTLGFLPESIVGSRRTDLLRMAKTDEEKNATNLLFDYQDKVDEANKIQSQIEGLKNPEFTSVEGYESDPGMKIKELEGNLKEIDLFLNKNEKAVNKVSPTIKVLADRLVDYNASNVINPVSQEPTWFGKIFGTTSVQDKKKLSEDIQKQTYKESEPEEKTIPFQELPIVGPDDYINELQQYRSGGRVGLKDGGGPKISRRGFLGFLAGAAAAPFAGKLIKGEKAVQATKVATKVLPKVADMPEWFPSLVARIEKEGIDISPKATRVEDIRTVKKIEVPVPGKEKPDIIKMTQYPNGAIHIEADVYGGSFDSPFDLHYRPPKSDIDLETGKQIVEPGEFSVIETRPRPVYDPHSADYELEYENMSVKDAISDLERVEKIATGKRIHPKRVEQREKARADVEDKPYEDIINRYGDRDIPDWWDPSDYASGGRVKFSGGGKVKFARMITDILDSLRRKLSFSSHLEKLYGTEKAKEQILSPYRIPEGTNKSQHSDILMYIDESRQNLPKEYNDLQNILNEIEKDINNYDYISADKKGRTLLDRLPESFNFEKLSQDLFPMEDPLNNAIILMDPQRNNMRGRFVNKVRINPETKRGTIETFDTFDTENKKWLSEDEWKLKGAESYEKGKEGLN
jgi:hypothetical protein